MTKQMATNSIRIDDATKQETTRIANELGITFNAVVNILLKKFNAEGGFFFPVKTEPKPIESVLGMTSEEFSQACKDAVKNREPNPRFPYTARIDQKTGLLMKQYADGRVEYVLD